MINHIDSTVRVRPPLSSAHGYAIVALNESGCQGHQDGLMLSGSIDVNVTGGGLFSNGCLRGNGVALTVDANGNPIRFVEELECDPDGCPGFSPQPGEAIDTLPEESYHRDPPDCSAVPDRGSVKVTGNETEMIYPGNYTKIEPTGGTLTMEPGLYCITGSPNAMKITGGALTGYKVTIYVTEGEVVLSGNANVALTAPDYEYAEPEIPGVLIYLAAGNTGAVELEGNSETIFDGIVYAPDGFIEAKGVAGLENPLNFSLQLIGHDVEITGNADINFYFDGSKFPATDTMVDMWK
jgi:hypothetical protein